MSHIAIAIPALIGFGLLVLASARHQQDWLHRKLTLQTTRWLRRAGLGALVLAFVAAGLGFGWAYGAVAWCGWLSFAAMLVLVAQTNRERIQRLFS